MARKEENMTNIENPRYLDKDYSSIEEITLGKNKFMAVECSGKLSFIGQDGTSTDLTGDFNSKSAKDDIIKHFKSFYETNTKDIAYYLDGERNNPHLKNISSIKYNSSPLDIKEYDALNAAMNSPENKPPTEEAKQLQNNAPKTSQSPGGKSLDEDDEKKPSYSNYDGKLDSLGDSDNTAIVKHIINSIGDRLKNLNDDIQRNDKKFNLAKKMGYVQGVCECVDIASKTDPDMAKKLLTGMDVTKDMAKKYANPKTYEALENGIFAQQQEQKREQTQGIKR